MTETKKFAALRIVFGFVWIIDAYFKWRPDFFANFASYLSGNLDNQSQLVKSWINLWIHIVGVNPQFFAFIVAISETAIALALIFGVASRITTWVGIAMSLVIWSTAEGFGGPYSAGSTDIGAAIIYVLVFLALWFGHAWEDLSLKKTVTFYQCPACGFHYRDKTTADKCEVWCKSHKSCNIEITAYAEENKTASQS